MKFKKEFIDFQYKGNQKNGRLRYLALSLCMLTFIGASAQTGKVSVNVKNAQVKELFDAVEKQTPYRFSYRDSEIAGKMVGSLDVKDEELESLLSRELKKCGLTYKVSGNKIIIIPISQQVAKPAKISGKVVDIHGEPVIGATIKEAGTSNGTITDFDGNFSLNAPSGAMLEISYVGYKSQLLEAVPGKMLSVTMREDSELLDEVVVVGYGTQKKVNLTGAVESVDSETLENRPIRSATDALQGAVSGLTVTSGTGQPGSFSSLKIRGNTSVNSAGALVIVDGMPGDLNLVNPQDIESISVLKDAASAAIYGARAAEGVILVTTRSGKSDKVKIEYSGNVSFNTPTRLPKSNTGLNHALLSNEAFTNAGLAVQFPEDAIAALKDPSIIAIPKGNDWIYTADMDWISLMMDHSFQQNHNLTISKVSEGLKYLFSAGWLDQNGLFAEYGPDNYDRLNVRSNISVDIIKEKLSLDSKITYLSSG